MQIIRVAFAVFIGGGSGFFGRFGDFLMVVVDGYGWMDGAREEETRYTARGASDDEGPILRSGRARASTPHDVDGRSLVMMMPDGR